MATRKAAKKKAADTSRSDEKQPIGIEMIEVDGKTLGQWLNLQTRQIMNLAQQGKIARTGRGKYNLYGSVLGYIQYLHAERSAGATKLEEDARLKAAQANLRELELAKARRELLPAVEVDETVSEVIAVMSAELGALASRVSPDCVGKNVTQVKKIIGDETRHIQQNMYTGVGDVAPSAEQVAEARQPAKASSTRRVGRRRKSVASGSRGAGTVSE